MKFLAAFITIFVLFVESAYAVDQKEDCIVTVVCSETILLDVDSKDCEVRRVHERIRKYEACRVFFNNGSFQFKQECGGGNVRVLNFPSAICSFAQ